MDRIGEKLQIQTGFSLTIDFLLISLSLMEVPMNFAWYFVISWKSTNFNDPWLIHNIYTSE